MSDVTRSLPEVVEIARRDLGGAPLVLDGEVVAYDATGRPLPFQELMRRFRRVHEVDRMVEAMPLSLHFFDCLIHEGRSLIDEPYRARWEALARVTGGRYLAERRVVDSAGDGRAFHASRSAGSLKGRPTRAGWKSSTNDAIRTAAVMSARPTAPRRSTSASTP